MSASPALKKNKTKKQQAAKKTKEDTIIMKQKLGNVSTITKFFEKTGLSTTVSASVVTSQSIHNNKGVCAATANQTLAVMGTRVDPEMALQSAAASQSIGSKDGETSGHLTSEEPIRARAPGPDQNQGDSSHIGQDHQKPLDSRGCSDGLYIVIGFQSRKKSV
jgi:hypothetical protein